MRRPRRAAVEPNPGGILALKDIVGRKREIEAYWRILKRQSLVLGAERRLGKTHILLKMHAEGRNGFISFYQDLEGIHSILELIRDIYRTIRPRLSTAGKLKAQMIAAWDAIVPKRYGDLELPDAAKNWKVLLRTAINDVLKVVPEPHRAIFMWDELPLMLYNIQQREGSSAVIELLDILRQVRQAHARLRFIFTGSIGLHLVLRALRAQGNANDPLNDMYADSVPPMREDEGFELARRILESLDPLPADIDAVARRMVNSVNGYPYFLHHVADELSRRDVGAVPADVDDVVTALIENPADRAHLGYFRSRIDTYYVESDIAIALALLDGLSVTEGSTDLETLVNLARHHCPALTDQAARTCLLLLEQDHYVQLTNSRYDFRWVILKRWWRRTVP